MGRLLVVVAAATLATACVAGPTAGDDQARPDPAAASGRPPREAYADGRDIVLAGDGAELILATVDDEDAELVHAVLRPGDHEYDTVLALTRVEDADAGGPRYELRYVIAGEGEISDLYWLPWRLQVDRDVARLLDVPPLPVWAPDGSAIAWIEWVGGGTRLRTVGWRDEDAQTNPSDDATAYDLDDVPAGTQLQAWQHGPDGHILVGRSDDQRWNIRLDAARDSLVEPDGGVGSPPPP